jgi:hypothetical protein
VKLFQRIIAFFEISLDISKYQNTSFHFEKKGFGGGVLRAIGAQLYGKLNICKEFMNELNYFYNFSFNICFF